MSPSSLLWKRLQGCVHSPRPTVAHLPSDTIVLFAPLDDVAHALQTLVAAFERSLTLECFTYCDKTLHGIVAAKAVTPGFTLAATFDEGQYLTVPSMRALVDTLPPELVAVGKSEHDEIVHRKVLVGDHEYVVNGSTNLTESGERFEDNELVIRRSAPLAAVYESVLAANHARIRALKAAAAPDSAAAPAPAAPTTVASATGGNPA